MGPLVLNNHFDMPSRILPAGTIIGTQSLFGWIAAQIPVQPHKCSTFGLRGVAVRMHWSTAADQPKSYESCLTVVTLIEGCPRKRNSAKQALNTEGAEHAQPLPVAERDLGSGPLPAWTAAIAARHVGQHGTFIEKHQPLRRNPANPGGIIRLPGRTRLYDVVALLLSRLDAALLSRPV